MRQYPILSVPDQFCKHRIATSDAEHRYALYMETKIDDLEHAFNMASGQRRFLHSTPDMWSPSTKTAYYFSGCHVHGHFKEVSQGTDGWVLQPCSYLDVGTTLDSRNIYGETYKDIKNRERRLHAKLLAETEIQNIVVQYQCEFEALMDDPTTDVHAFFQSLQYDLPPPLRIRDSLRGGHTELYCMEAVTTAESVIRYYDINSL